MSEYDLLAVGVNPAIDSYFQGSRIELGSVNRIERVCTAAGGKAINFARAYSRIGGRPLATGIAGGNSGLRIIHSMNEEGIANDFVLTSVESRNTYTVVSETGTTVFLEPGPQLAHAAFELLAEKVAELSKEVPWVVFAGSLPPTARPDYISELVQSTKTTTPAKVALDTSGEPLRQAAAHGVDLIKINAQEFRATFGIDAVTQEHIRHVWSGLNSCGVPVVCVTDGARGAFIAHRDDCFVVNSPVEQVVSTAGAGDAFLAGLLSGLKSGHTLREAAKLGAAAGAAATQSIGAGFIDPVIVRRMLDKAYYPSADEFFAGDQT